MRSTRVFVSGAASTSHLVHLASWLRWRLDASSGPVHVVVLGLRGFLGGRVTPADVEQRFPRDPRLTVSFASGPADWRGRHGEDLVYLAVGAPGIKPWLRLRRANGGSVRCVVVDEGLGSYGDWRSRWSAGRREKHRPIWSLVRAVAVTTAQRRLTDERWALFRCVGGRWELDERVAAEFRRQLAGTAPPPGRAVFVAQPWVELGVLSAARYREVLHEVSAACSAAGLSLLIRPHPAEHLEYYAGLYVDRGAVPAEIDRAACGDVVLGFSSTALASLPALHGIPAVRIALPDLVEVDAGMSAQQRSLLASWAGEPVPLELLADRLSALG